MRHRPSRRPAVNTERKARGFWPGTVNAAKALTARMIVDKLLAGPQVTQRVSVQIPDTCCVNSPELGVTISLLQNCPAAARELSFDAKNRLRQRIRA